MSGMKVLVGFVFQWWSCSSQPTVSSRRDSHRGARAVYREKEKDIVTS